MPGTWTIQFGDEQVAEQWKLSCQRWGRQYWHRKWWKKKAESRKSWSSHRRAEPKWLWTLGPGQHEHRVRSGLNTGGLGDWWEPHHLPHWVPSMPAMCCPERRCIPQRESSQEKRLPELGIWSYLCIDASTKVQICVSPLRFSQASQNPNPRVIFFHPKSVLHTGFLS